MIFGFAASCRIIFYLTGNFIHSFKRVLSGKREEELGDV